MMKRKIGWKEEEILRKGDLRIVKIDKERNKWIKNKREGDGKEEINSWKKKIEIRVKGEIEIEIDIGREIRKWIGGNSEDGREREEDDKIWI